MGLVLRCNSKTLCDPLVAHLPNVEHVTEQGDVLDGGAWEAEGASEDNMHVRPFALQTREFLHGEDAVDLQGVNECSADIIFKQEAQVGLEVFGGTLHGSCQSRWRCRCRRHGLSTYERGIHASLDV